MNMRKAEHMLDIYKGSIKRDIKQGNFYKNEWLKRTSGAYFIEEKDSFNKENLNIFVELFNKLIRKIKE